MQIPGDYFSEQAELYKKYRPVYPPALYRLILNHSSGRGRAWDVGTGNGQVARVLADHFEQVVATDISARQLAQAEPRPNITYRRLRAEQTDFPDEHFDLVSVAQAAHWFDTEAFHLELQRVLRPGGLFARWGYGLLRIAPEVDALIDTFYWQTLQGYWHPQRRHIDQAYASLPFPFEEIPVPDLRMVVSFTVEALCGYFRSWSSVQNYRKQCGENPVDALEVQLREVWAEGEEKTAVFPLFLKMGRNGARRLTTG